MDLQAFTKKIAKFFASVLPVLVAVDRIYHRLLEVFKKE